MSARLLVNILVCLALITPAFPANRLPDTCTAITIGQTVNGSIAVAGEEDCFTFTASARQTVYFDAISSSISYVYLSWRLVDGALISVFSSNYFDDQHKTLSAGGSYTLTVDGDGDDTATYSFKLWNVPAPNQFTIQIGDLVSNGVPGAGAGNIETPGVEDRYTFTTTAGQEVYFDAISSSISYVYLSWQLEDGGGQEVWSSQYFDDQRKTLSAGTYTLIVDGDGDYVATYSFKLWNVPTPDQFAIQVGDLVSNGVPGAGAGNIETPGVEDRYTFAAAAGQEIYFDAIDSSISYVYLSWRLEDGDDQEVWSSSYFDDKRAILSAGGTYSMTVDGDGDNTAAYSFKLYDIPEPDEFTIRVGDLVLNGIPGAGAGNIETPGVIDHYTFTATAGQEIFFDTINSTVSYVYLSWRLEDAGGHAVFSSNYFDDQVQTLAAGTYTLIVDGDGDVTATYSFRLWDLAAPDWTPLEIGVSVTDTLTHSMDTTGYSVAAAAGQYLSIQVDKDSGWYSNLYVRYGAHPSASEYDVRSFRAYNDQEVTIPATQAGTYYILLESGDYHPDYGAYSITARLLASQNLPLNTPQDITSAAGSTLVYRINVPTGTLNLFARLQKTSAWAGEFRLFEDDQELDSATGPGDLLIQVPAPVAGTYYIAISGEGQGVLTASSTLPALAPGTWKTGTILRRWGSAWYQLQLPAGQSALNLRVEALGLYSQLFLYRGSFNNPPLDQVSGNSMQLSLASLVAGTYYLHLTDSATVIGADQERDHMIQAAAQAIDPPPCTAPVIGSFSPVLGGTGGPVTVSISGQCLAENAAVCLARAGQTKVCSSDVTGQADRRLLRARFDLMAAAPGDWSLQVTNPGLASVAAPAAFKVQSQGEPQLWVEITGREQIRIGRFSTYHVQYGNAGPVDAYDVAMNISVPTGWEIEWDMPHPDLDTVDWESVSGIAQAGDRQVIPFWFLKVGAGAQDGFDFRVMIPDGEPGAMVQLKAEIVQADSAYARSGDLDDVRSSPNFEAVVTGIRAAFEHFQPRPAGTAGGGLNAPLDVPPDQEIRDALWNYIQGLSEPFGAEEVIGGAVGGIIAYAICGPLGAYIAAGVAVGAIIGFAINQYEYERAKADILYDVIDELDAMQISSVSPEDKYGPSGYDPAGTPVAQLKRWIPANRPIHYRIDFWNKENAPAATQDVIITDQLDPDLDWSSFRFTEVGFLDWRAAIEPTQYFNLDIAGVSIDLSPYYPGQPVVDLVVNVEGTFDPSTGAIEWQYHALDPFTRDYPENPYAGFLPPYTASGWEIGWANFTVLPKSGAASGTTVSNQAFVKFDLNPFNPAPKAGPFVNTLDAAAPVAVVKTPSGNQSCSSFLVAWTAQDDAKGSGVGGVDVYIDNLDDVAPSYLWLQGTSLRSAVFQGKPGARYGFYAIAMDRAGNVQATPSPIQYEVQTRAGLACIYMPITRKAPR